MYSKLVKVFINSRDRTAGTNEDFLYTFNTTPLEKCIGFSVSDIVIPQTYYVVNASTNRLTITESVSGAHLVTLPSGNYSLNTGLANDLIPALAIAINGAGASNTYAVTYSAITGKITITRSLGVEGFYITFPADSALSSIIGEFPGAIFGTTYTSNKVARVGGPTEIFMLSSTIAGESKQLLTSIENSAPSIIVAKVPIANLTKQNQSTIADSLQTEVIVYNSTDDQIQSLNKCTITQMRLRLSFSSSFVNSTVDLNNNSWSTTLVFYLA